MFSMFVETDEGEVFVIPNIKISVVHVVDDVRYEDCATAGGKT